jgi:hypothetical protein
MKTPSPIPIGSLVLKEYCLLLNLFNFYQHYLVVEIKKNPILIDFYLNNKGFHPI